MQYISLILPSNHAFLDFHYGLVDEVEIPRIHKPGHILPHSLKPRGSNRCVLQSIHERSLTRFFQSQVTYRAPEACGYCEVKRRPYYSTDESEY